LRRHATIGIVLLVLSLALGLAAVSGMTTHFDLPLLRKLALRESAPGSVIRVTKFVSALGNPDVRGIFIAGFLALFVWQQRWRAALSYAIAVAMTIVSYSVMKEILARPRPTLSPWFDDPVNLAYPSGHAAGAAIILILGAMLARRTWVMMTALALTGAIGVSRVVLGVHWPTDVIGGWLWGGGAALLGYVAAGDTGKTRKR
jgi:undecaprenyl-diphosphatase